MKSARAAGLMVAAAHLVSGGFAGPLHAYKYNISYTTSMPLADGYEEQQFITAVTGLWNRHEPSLFLYEYDIDVQWFNIASQPGGWLAQTQWTELADLNGLIQAFNPIGVVLYDPAVPSTSLLASSITGVSGLLPVAYKPDQPSSLYSRVVAGGPKLTVGQSLVGMFNASTGLKSAKGNAYTWAIDQLLSSSSPTPSDGRYLGYYADAFCSGPPYNGDAHAYDKITVTNQDWVIAQGGFLFDIGVWDDEAPVDDPAQPIGTDTAVLRSLLLAAYNATLSHKDGGTALVHISGFTPWWCKYTGSFSKHNHGGVDAEWATALLTSAFNAFVDADACCIGNMLSASFWQHYPLPDRMVQRPPPSRQQLIDSGLLYSNGTVPIKLFYYWYFGDYDSAAWAYSQVLPRWGDEARGSVPIGWPIDPELAMRFPPLFPLMYSQATPADVLITGDSGAGYINPTALTGITRSVISGLPNATGLWTEWNTAWYRQMGMTFTGFVITGDAPSMSPSDEAAYYSYSPNGMGQQQFGHKEHVTGNLPVLIETDIPTDVPTAVKTVQSQLPAPGATHPRFWMFRSVLTSPSFLAQVSAGAANASAGQAVVVDPLTLAYLMRVNAGASNDDRVAYIADNLPPSAPAGLPLSFTLTIRNDGWNVLGAVNHSVLVSVMGVSVYGDGEGEGRGSHRPTRLGDRRYGIADLSAALSSGILPTFPSNPARARIVLKRHNAHTLCTVGTGLPDVTVPFPQDLQLGGTVNVTASVPTSFLSTLLPSTCPGLGLTDGVMDQGSGQATGKGRDSLTVITVQYQVQVSMPDGSMRMFADNGNIPWQAAVVLQ